MAFRTRVLAALLAVAAAPVAADALFDDENPAQDMLVAATRQAPATRADCPPPTAFNGEPSSLVKVGEEVAVAVENTEFNGRGAARLAWQHEIFDPGATYIAPHFRHFNLPEGATLTIRSVDGSRSWTYTGEGKTRHPGREGFWGIHIPGDVAILEIHSSVPVGRGRVTLDGYARGFKAATSKALSDVTIKAICGSDDSRWAQCYQTSEPQIYARGRAVARLLIQGTSACTGWLVGDAGDLMTNQHCISTANDAANTDYEFMAEGSCSQNCASFGACPGTVVATSASLTKASSPLDYALVRLPVNASTTYGYLQMRTSGAILNERIYITGHPAAWGKRFSVASTDASDQSGFCEVFSNSMTPCSGGPGDTGYACDTQGGSSGSPVLAYADHAVVSLHHCGPCNNRGVPITAVIADLGSNLPPNSTVGGNPPPPPTCGPVGASCTTNSDCCSNSCKGKPGRKVCK
jgi:hypothetical protein